MAGLSIPARDSSFHIRELGIRLLERLSVGAASKNPSGADSMNTRTRLMPAAPADRDRAMVRLAPFLGLKSPDSPAEEIGDPAGAGTGGSSALTLADRADSDGQAGRHSSHPCRSVPLWPVHASPPRVRRTESAMHAGDGRDAMSTPSRASDSPRPSNVLHCPVSRDDRPFVRPDRHIQSAWRPHFRTTPQCTPYLGRTHAQDNHDSGDCDNLLPCCNPAISCPDRRLLLDTQYNLLR